MDELKFEITDKTYNMRDLNKSRVCPECGNQTTKVRYDNRDTHIAGEFCRDCSLVFCKSMMTGNAVVYAVSAKGV